MIRHTKKCIGSVSTCRSNSLAFEKNPQPIEQRLHVTQLALPDNVNRPPQVPQGVGGSAVTFLVGLDLGHPVTGPGLGSFAFRAAVTVPEAPVHEDRFLATRQGDVGRAGQVAAMDPEAIAGSEQRSPHRQLRASVLRPDGLHDPPPLCW
jgi:hypothetical protein